MYLLRDLVAIACVVLSSCTITSLLIGGDSEVVNPGLGSSAARE